MDNVDLEKLRISPGRLVPKFQSRVTEYSVTVASEITEVKLTPITSDSGASCTIKVGWKHIYIYIYMYIYIYI